MGVNTALNWKVDEVSYDFRVDIESIRLQRELVKNEGGIQYKSIPDHALTQELDEIKDGRYIAYPMRWAADDVTWLIFSDQILGQKINHFSIPALAELVYDAVNTPDDMKWQSTEDWGHASITTNEAKEILALDTNHKELAKELWGKAATIMPLGDAGTGLWPKAPKRTNQEAGPTYERLEGTILTLTIEMASEDISVKGQIAPRWSRKYEVCDRELYFRTKREVSKAHCEMSKTPIWWIIVSSQADLNRFMNRNRTRVKRNSSSKLIYAVYPFHDDGDLHFGIVHNQSKEKDKQLFPSDRTEALDLMTPWQRTPEDMKRRYSQRYGGLYQGTNSDGRRKVIKQLTGEDKPEPMILQLITSKNPKTVAKIIGRTLNANLYERWTIDDPIELISKLTAEITDLKTRNGIDGLTAFLDWYTSPSVDESETPIQASTKAKGDGKQPEPIYLPGIGEVA